MAAIQQVKQKIARLLGFDHYADLSLETKMAPNVTSVIGFLDDLATKAKPQAFGRIYRAESLCIGK